MEAKRVPLTTCMGMTGNVALSGELSGGLRVWDAGTGRRLGKLPGNGGCPVTALALDPDASCAISGDADGAVRFWELDAFKLLGTQRGHTAGAITGALLHPHEARAVTACTEGLLHVWENPFSGHQGNLATTTLTLNPFPVVPVLALADDGLTRDEYTAFCGLDLAGGGLGVWDLEEGRLVHVASGLWAAEQNPEVQGECHGMGLAAHGGLLACAAAWGNGSCSAGLCDWRTLSRGPTVNLVNTAECPQWGCGDSTLAADAPPDASYSVRMPLSYLRV
eukprot:gene12987-15349_t